ncbi:MAG: ABC-2 family transporter protein [Myxococcales bacterium]|nr:ABC-2 family transporter protein [Myxococcales bacterium]
MWRSLRAYPALLRVGLAEMVAYRAEFLVWILTTNMPLVMMGLWTAVAASGPVGRFGQRDFVTYYLAVLVVRIVTNNWLVWEMTMDIRQGALATRLLRPISPLVQYSAEHIAAVPIRMLMVSPVVAVLIYVGGDPLLFGSFGRAAVFAFSLLGAWLILFFTMLTIGSLAMFVESALSIFDMWLAIHFVLSGYLFPLELLPTWVTPLSRALPFRYMLAFPVETWIGKLSLLDATRDLGIQWLFVAGMASLAAVTWRQGLRRFIAFGG